MIRGRSSGVSVCRVKDPAGTIGRVVSWDVVPGCTHAASPGTDVLKMTCNGPWVSNGRAAHQQSARSHLKGGLKLGLDDRQQRNKAHCEAGARCDFVQHEVRMTKV
jgi:hypothetical protein